MIDVKKLRKIMEEKGADPNVTMHDLIREVLKRDYDKEDYTIKNISDPAKEDDSSSEAETCQGSIVHKNFDQVEESLRGFLKNGRQDVKLDAHDREAGLFQSIEELRKNAKRNWVHHLKANPSNENYKL
jgi:hypothetical protein